MSEGTILPTALATETGSLVVAGEGTGSTRVSADTGWAQAVDSTVNLTLTSVEAPEAAISMQVHTSLVLLAESVVRGKG